MAKMYRSLQFQRYSAVPCFKSGVEITVEFKYSYGGTPEPRAPKKDPGLSKPYLFYGLLIRKTDSFYGGRGSKVLPYDFLNFIHILNSRLKIRNG